MLITSNIRAPLIDGLGHETRSATVPVCRSRTQSFQENRPFNFQAHVVLKPLVLLMGRLVTCSARISVDTQTDTQTTTVTLAARARRGLITATVATSTVAGLTLVVRTTVMLILIVLLKKTNRRRKEDHIFEG